MAVYIPSTKYLQLKCEFCEGGFLIPYARNKNTLNAYLATAVCPHCRRPRTKATTQSAWHCQSCQLPEPFVHRQSKYNKICLKCYMRDYKRKYMRWDKKIRSWVRNITAPKDCI